MIKVNVMPRKRVAHKSWGDSPVSTEFKLVFMIVILAALGVLLWWKSGIPSADDFKQECFEQGGSEAIETEAGQVLCLQSYTIAHPHSPRPGDKNHKPPKIIHFNSNNPPILHRKELLLPENHPEYEKWREITRRCEAAGLFRDSRRIGRKRAWEELLKKAGLHGKL